MRAAQIEALGQPPTQVVLPEPDGANVTIEAVALNPLDIAVGSGAFYGGHPPLPYVPGCEAAGRTEDGVPVYLFGGGRGVSSDGFLAERVAFDDWLPLAPDVDLAVAAAAGIAGVAAWVSVAWRAEVAPGDRVVVLGASGSVGKVAMQAARLLGADEVTGASRSGGDGLVTYDELPDGYTVCIDPVWGEPLARTLAKAAPRARIVHLGQAAGPESPLRSADVRGKELRIIGHSSFALTDDDRNRAYLELLDHVTAGRIVLDVERFPLEDAAAAWERQRSGAGAKVVVELAS